MHRLLTRAFLGLVVFSASLWFTCLLFAAPQAAARPVATIRKVSLLGGGNSVEVEIVASSPVTPQAQAVTGPDRIVIDFPNALPGAALRHLTLHRGGVKAVRAGLFSSNPPVTRVVLDLVRAQPYQLFPSGNTVIVKLSAGEKQATAFNTQFEIVENLPLASEATVRTADAPAPPAKPASRVEVEFRNGKLSIWADKATLADVLYQVHRKTGADIPIPAGAEQEPVVVQLGPAPAREVLASLLNGSRFNFIMVGAEDDPAQLRSLLLSLKPGTVPQGSAYPSPSPVARVAPVPQPPPASEPDPPEIPGAAEPPQQ
jgi:hypothetical protein